MNSKNNCVFWYNYFKVVSPNLLITWKKIVLFQKLCKILGKVIHPGIMLSVINLVTFFKCCVTEITKFSCQFHYNKLSDLKYWVFLSLFSFTESYCLHCCFSKYVSPSERFIGRTLILPLEYSFLINFQIISLNWIRIYRTRMEKLMAS